jgi:peptide/nickel transport system permease protein
MVNRESASFNLRRFGGVIKILLKNKMSVVGLVLLIGFVFMALAAPALTPDKPTQTVSGFMAQPAWVMDFPDGYHLSQNLQVAPDPTFRSASSVQDWNITTSSAGLSRLDLSYVAGFSPKTSPGGSLRIVYSGSGPMNVTLSRSFFYPYHGPPSALSPDGMLAFVSVLNNTDQQTPVGLQLFIDKGSQFFTLYNSNQSGTTAWQAIESNTVPSIGGQVAKPVEIIFSTVQSYVFGITITFFGPGSLSLNNLQLSLQGTAFGIFGTDNSGFDVYSQLVYGARISLFVGLLAALIGIGLGLLIGLMAGFLGKAVDQVLMRFTDMMLTIPALPLLIVLASVLGANIWNLIIIIGFLGWMGFARVIRSQVLSLRERPFVEAAKAAGAGPGRIMATHIFPNIVSLTYVNLALSVPAAILTEAALEFLGLGDPSVVSWGNMFNHVQIAGADVASTGGVIPWWWIVPPGVAIALISLSFVLIGYALDEIFNPKLRKRQ